tara:strand:- start:909 stop:1145 length:237 start_codon:yes stop_codon:yes gene_type:complete
MKIENILEAEKEAKRFLKRLEELKKSEINGHRLKSKRAKIKGTDFILEYTYPSKETSALKRSSMDLTRSLSKMRNDTY